MTERDRVDRVVALAIRELSPSLEDKARHRAPLGLGPAATGRTASGLATGATGAAGRAESAASGWRALRASGRAGWTAGALLLGGGVALGFWLRGSLPNTPPIETSAVAVTNARSAANAIAPSPSTATLSPTVPAAPGAPVSPSADASTRDGHSAPAAEQSLPQVEAATAGVRAVPPRARARAKLERRATGPGVADDQTSFVPQPFDEELALLQRVQRAMRASEYSLALALLTELDERFATTRLEEERRAARLIAECRLELPGSRQRGEHFLEQRPNSVYANRLQLACSTPR